MEISIKVLDENNEMYGERICNTVAHPTMMWIRTFVRQAVIDPEKKIRLDIEWNADANAYSTHMEITNGDKWFLTYVEDEVFCDTTLEFDTRGELFDFIRDILKNIEEADSAWKVWT